jgi:hypothetical protein
MGIDDSVAEKFIAFVGWRVVEETTSVLNNGNGVVSARSSESERSGRRDEFGEKVKIVMKRISENESVDFK